MRLSADDERCCVGLSALAGMHALMLDVDASMVRPILSAFMLIDRIVR